MPERVHTIFDDEATVPKIQTADSPLAQQNAPAIHGTKRKRELGTHRQEAVERGAEAVKKREERDDGLVRGESDLEKFLHKKTVNSNGTNEAHKTSIAQPPRAQARQPSKQSNHISRRSNGPAHNPLREKASKLLPFRQKLPIWPHAKTIRSSLRDDKDVLFLVGETGSGKSTQVPQFLLSESWCTGRIAITQPRRVAAISLARRVAEEMGTPLGSASPASKVGYSVRFDNCVSAATKVKYLTEGMLLQEMLRDQSLAEYSVVVVDEVHERSVNVDLVLGFLRRLVVERRKQGKILKVVVMSATAEMEGLMKFFSEGFNDGASKAGSPTEEEIAKSARSDASEESDAAWSGLSSDDSASPKRSKLSNKTPANGSALTAGEHHGKPKLKGVSDALNESKSDSVASSPVSNCYIEGRQYKVDTIYLPTPTHDFVEAALKTVFQIHLKEPLPGDILVFLTGQDTVESLEKLINDYAADMDPQLPKLLVLPLFAALPQPAQQRVFHPAPRHTRKVIISTNLAETSVTVPGVRHVVDSGKFKIKQFRARLGLDSLLVKSISQSSAIQRQGRAGREAEGTCYRLYTEKDYRQLPKATLPEILRCDLSSALLTMKARGVQDVLHFPLLDPPPRDALEKALLQLLHLGALTENGAISATGLQIAKLPLTPCLGKVIVEAAQRACLPEVIDIIACLSVENIFLALNTEEKREVAEIARRELLRREGDHLTMLATVRAYAAERSDRRAWAERHFVSHRAMQNVVDVRKQLLAQCKQLKLLSETGGATAGTDEDAFSEEKKAAILQSLLRGFAANTARLMPDGSYKTLLGNQTVAVHPSSVLFGRKVEAVVFSEFVFTTKSFARGVSAVRLEWVGEVVG